MKSLLRHRICAQLLRLRLLGLLDILHLEAFRRPSCARLVFARISGASRRDFMNSAGQKMRQVCMSRSRGGFDPCGGFWFLDRALIRHPGAGQTDPEGEERHRPESRQIT
jgi:hypothetical protein